MNRQDFPILNQLVNKRPLVYLDNAATTQRPECVINSLSEYYNTINSNIHRGVHHLSQLATSSFEEARDAVRAFINAKSSAEIVFTRGTTESINLISASYGKKFIHSGDEIIISEMEHHANIVPWQFVCEERGATLKVIPISDDGVLDIEAFKKLISPKTKIVSVAHVSNTLGTINPVKEIISIAHSHGVPVLIDGAQAISHELVDVQDWDCDFYCFSGHKMYAPMGVGVMYGKKQWLEEMPPYQGGGEMIKKVTFEHTTYNELPFKFEAGTPSVADVLGLKVAIDYINVVGKSAIAAYENELLVYATSELLKINGLRIIGTAQKKSAIISFLLDGTHPYDVGVILDQLGIAVRTGHHCTMPLMDRFNIPGTVRASFAMYNTKEDVDRLVEAVEKAKMMLS
ncbi:MAG: cysteine desulfurase [Bacteroidales bacterium]|nr:cysteine desulfurase [Bacteroidales bacterium]